MDALRFDRIEEFIERRLLRAARIENGDGIAWFGGSDCKRDQGGRAAASHAPSLRGRGELCTGALEGDLSSGPTALYDLFRVEKNCRALGCLDAYSSARSMETQMDHFRQEVEPASQLRRSASSMSTGCRSAHCHVMA